MSRSHYLAAMLTFGVLATACAAIWNSDQAAYGVAADQCTMDASTRAQDDDCRCRVRLRYPSAPQCVALPDGGWIVPTAAPQTDGAVK